MTRILHVSDTHLGKRQYDRDFREDDVYDTFKQVIDKAIEEKVDAVIHTGDFFDKNEPPNKAVLVALKELKRLKEKGIPFIAIAGDHDSPKRGSSIFPQRILEEEGLLVLLDHQKTEYSIGDLNIQGLSHIPLTGASVLKERLAKMKPASKKSILLLHQGVRTLLPYQYSYQIDLSDLPKGFGIIALGHFHDRFKTELDGGTVIEIAGSPEIISTSEIEGYEKNKKGITLIDYSTADPTFTYINMDIRPQFEVVINTDKLDNDIKSIVTKFSSISGKKPILHITLEGSPVKKSLIVNRLRELSKVSEYYRIAHDNTSYLPDQTEVRPPSSSSLDEMIMTYLTKVANYNETEAKLILSLIHEEDDEEITKILKKLSGYE
ncbi:DNA double-strand break repair protein Mre11 [Stygiolobus caldivivus]|uniref:DNA double-strand break repair protein Mre11 n=1 Tax=Stygiolobus caldivivus TaxID=2824673 RepID=A0A8D5U4P4_9CREN|nr:DNA double-strand break repair protein Mre11 [Stygiolobus caldivivus]BCU69229.1 2-hydroxyacid dehydrogenase [Stygiolobus caldivivus]